MTTPRHIIAHLLNSETSDVLEFDWFSNAQQRQLAVCLDYLRWCERLTDSPLRNISIVERSAMVKTVLDLAWVHDELMACARLGVVPGAISRVRFGNGGECVRRYLP